MNGPLQPDHEHDEDDDEVKTEVIDGCTLITTTAWRNSRNAAVGGIGIMKLNPTLWTQNILVSIAINHSG